MDFIRSRRGEPPRGQEPDLEQQSHRPDMEEQQQRGQELQSRRGRPILRSLFTRDPGSRQGEGEGEGQRPDDIESPKSPPPPRRSTPGNRIHLPSLARPTRERRGSSRRRHHHRGDQRPEPESTAETGSEAVTRPERSHRTEDAGRRRFRGTDPAESQLADLAEDERRRRHHRHHDRGQESSSRRQGGGSDGDGGDGSVDDSRSHRDRPSRFLFCFPWIESRRMRSQVLRCFVSGMFLMLMLSIYLALSLTKNINSSEFTILLILVILATTIFFCHGLVRLCLMVLRPRGREDDDEEQQRRRAGGGSSSDGSRGPLPQYYGPGGYAIPRRPIRVVLARDEEAAGILDSEAAKLQPPAYGLWRESVRVDPNRIYWQRNEQHRPEDDEDGDGDASSEGTGATGRRESGAGADRPRPPSYASDDGVEYVVEARPRSIVPTAEVMQQHQHSRVMHQVQTPTSATSEWPSSGLGR
ncbi:hypothetical protein F4775DRAFT_323565 [Biscogniauxia sp. FL1348]|nr:hypothetical protein F4775DRAFT_323565 [Biscogniauxia sp. FL1348]